MLRIKLTEKDIKACLKALTIQVDTREQKSHTIEYFEKAKIPYKKLKLDYGDYSCYIPKGTIKGIDFDLNFDKYIVIERKQNIDELAGNFSSKDFPRISKEFAQLKANNTKSFIFIEEPLFDKHIRNGQFRSKYDPKRLYARIKGFEAEYNTLIRPVNETFIASEIYHTLYYFVRDYLMRHFKVDLLEE